MSLACKGVMLAVPGRVLCRGLSFTVTPGEVWAVLGANGSGKTTLLHAIAGLKPCAAGEVSWNGVPPGTHPGRERAREVGLLMQQEDSTFWGST
ncbi:MAG: ABC transporter ATP-binding protein, partial [Betaproteobacteria bacterium]|nr:ABC transporter ATP-binding protein [Betaproteobacteria bacterium]